MKLLTNKQYVERSGMICPWCLSDDLEWGDMEAESRGANQFVSCNKCEKEWLDIHGLTGFAEI